MRLRVIVAVAFLAASPLFGCSKSEAPTAPTPAGSPPSVTAPARVAADFTVTTVSGQRLSLSELKGKVVLLDFWATWCPPCQASIPHLKELQAKYQDKGLVVIGLSFDQDRRELEEFVKAKKINYAITQAPEATSKAYNVSSIPRMFVIDRAGNIKGDFLGFSEQIGQNIEAAATAALNK